MVHKDIYRNGTRLVSVTELTTIIAKPFLDKWRENLCCADKGLCGFVLGKQKAEEAAQLGNQVHMWVADHLTNTQSTIFECEAQKWMDKIVDVYKQHDVVPTIIMPEQQLIDEESGLSGSPDQVVRWDGRTVIADIKVKNQLDPLTALQGVGYSYLLKRLYNVTVNEMMVVWAKKKTKGYLVEPVSIDLLEWRTDWEAVVKLWNRLNPKRQVRVHA